MQKSLDLGRAGSGPVSPEGFHPAVAGWFASRFAQPTEVQRQAWAVTARHEPALIAAPTGSGKTLAAFMAALNDLVVEGLERGLSDEVHVLYVSPLKALSNDIQKNLQAPLAGIRAQLAAQGYPDVDIRDAVRTGDTSAFERARMRRTPPHILVTTPESLFILLTSESGRAMLSRVRSVIVDELHAVAGSKRGAHLMLSLARLDELCRGAGHAPPVRIGLSATQKPIERMAQFLMGGEHARCHLIDTGHVRERDLALELPQSPLETVMANEVWSELYDRLAELAQAHRTTLIFVNTRRLAERAARHLAERIGEEHVSAHHGSLSKEHRLKAEQRLKAGELRALIATSSLELGIDIGDVDLVCQLGSPRSMAAFLQRVGRSGHAVNAVPKGRLFPLSLDDLVECAALLDGVRRGELDRIPIPRKPLDVLAQQIVAEVACREWRVQALYELFRSAEPYRELARAEFDAVVQMLAEGFSTRRGRRSAHLHYDAVNGLLRGRKGARLTAVTNAGVIPDPFDYDVVLSPEGHRVGSVGEDFAFESIPGDIFQLGNTSYRMLKIETGKVYVEDAHGQSPSLPFWFGEAPGRSDELSQAVSRLRTTAEQILDGDAPDIRPPLPLGGEGQGEGGTGNALSPGPSPASGRGEERVQSWLAADLNFPPAAAQQLARYLAASKAALTVLPTHDTIVFERFFDEAGDTHLVIHSPYGSRINKAWGLALRKRFCRQFNFELQASALDDSIVLSLGPTHSFPLEDIKGYLKSASAREVLVQALLDAPMFGTRWRWNASIALAVRRMRNGQRVAPQLQRMDAEDLLAVVFPDQLACAENLGNGYREIPEHPLVQQTIHDCLHETMDMDGLLRLLARIENGELRIVSRELTSPSPLAEAILGARPYAFLDDGAAEERRTRAVKTRGLLEPQEAADLGRLDPQAIERVRQEAWPDLGTPDELHDALAVHGFLTAEEGKGAATLSPLLSQQRRATILQTPNGQPLYVATERLPQFRKLFPQAQLADDLPLLAHAEGSVEEALADILRGRLELLGPVTEDQLAAPLGLPVSTIRQALLALEQQGSVMRGRFTSLPLPPSVGEGRDGREEMLEWCDRRLLARIHRYSTERRRAEIQPVPPAAFMRFLFRWQRVGEERHEGEAGLALALQQLEGFAVPAAAWESDILPARVRGYLPTMLDRLCAAGRIVWCRPPSPATEERRKSGPVKTTPIVLCERAHWRDWMQLPSEEAPKLSARAQRVFDCLRQHGASFFSDLIHETGLLRAEVEEGLAELVSHGLVTSDSFAGLRALVAPVSRGGRSGRRRAGLQRVDEAGRWSLQRLSTPRAEPPGALADPAVERVARVLLRRYGVVFRRLLEREDNLPPWRELYYVYRRLEARGEIRGGRFVSGFSGEQFALPEAVGLLRAQAEGEPALVSISAADPLNLLGILLPGEKLPALPGNRLLFRGGQVVAVQLSGEVRYLESVPAETEWEWRNLLVRQAKHAAFQEQPARPQ
jgi:ATP-dependent Lhr-like helicase